MTVVCQLQSRGGADVLCTSRFDHSYIPHLRQPDRQHVPIIHSWTNKTTVRLLAAPWEARTIHISLCRDNDNGSKGGPSGCNLSF